MDSINSNVSAEVQECRIVVVGIGSSGKHIINTMLEAENRGIEFIAANGESDYEIIRNKLVDADIVFITGGAGGKTGRTIAPVISKMAKNLGALVIGVVTRPFLFEGEKRHKISSETITELKKVLDSVVVIPNDKLPAIINFDMHSPENFKIVNTIIIQTIVGVIGVVSGNRENDITLDFADLYTVMSHQGIAIAGIGEAQGEKAAYEATLSALEFANNELFHLYSAKGVLVHFTMHPKYEFMELSNAMDVIHTRVHESADVVFGTTTDENLPVNFIRVAFIATGFEQMSMYAANNIHS